MFHDKEICKAGLIFTCLAVIAIDYTLKKWWKLLSKSAFKRI